MALSRLDRCLWAATTSGVSDFGIGAAIPGYLTPAQASAVINDTYSYAAQTLDDANNITAWECGTGTYQTGVWQRTSITFSSNANAKVNFASPPMVLVSPLAVDFAGGGSSTITEGSTPTSGFTDGYALISNGDLVEEAPIRQLLTGDITGYINSATGSNSNPWPGTIGAPLFTEQYAYDYASSFVDGGGFSATINLEGAGPYTLDAESGLVGFETFNTVGAGSSVTTLNDLVFGWTNTFELGGVLNFDGLTYGYTAAFEGTIGQFALGVVTIGNVTGDTVINPGGFTFGCSGPNVQLQLYGNVEITSGTAHNFYSASEDAFIFLGNPVITLTGTPVFDFAFAATQLGGFVDGQGETYSGAATGTRFFASGGGRLFCFSPSTTFYPGDSEGILITGGDFVGLVRHQIVAPSTGDTVAMSFLQPTTLLTPAGTLATLTIVLPPLPGSGFVDLSVYNSYDATLSTTEDITALTVTTSDGSTIAGSPSTLLANTGFSWEWDAGTNVWYPLVGSENSGGGGGLAVGTPISGGAAGQVLYDDGGTLQESAGLVFNQGGATLAIANLSGTCVLELNAQSGSAQWNLDAFPGGDFAFVNFSSGSPSSGKGALAFDAGTNAFLTEVVSSNTGAVGINYLSTAIFADGTTTNGFGGFSTIYMQDAAGNTQLAEVHEIVLTDVTAGAISSRSEYDTVTAGVQQSAFFMEQQATYNPTVAFADRPGSPVSGMEINFSDSPVNIWGTNITTGGGSFNVKARYNGSNWTVTGI